MRKEARVITVQGQMALIRKTDASAEERRRALPWPRVYSIVRAHLHSKASSAWARKSLLDLFSGIPRPQSHHRTRDDQLLDRFRRELEQGRILGRLIPRPSGYGVTVAAPAEAPPPEPPPPVEELTWVEVVLLDEEGSPMAGLKCKLELPDGSTREVKLDDRGSYRVNDIPPGTCQVSFPDVPVNVSP